MLQEAPFLIISLRREGSSDKVELRNTLQKITSSQGQSQNFYILAFFIGHIIASSFCVEKYMHWLLMLCRLEVVFDNADVSFKYEFG